MPEDANQLPDPADQPADQNPPDAASYPPKPEEYIQAQQPGGDPYGGTPPTSYGVPPAGGPPPYYSVPPVGGPPPYYGIPPFPQLPPPYPGSDYGPMPKAEPLPPELAIRDLPRQYRKIFFKPGAQSFVEEQTKAGWGIIWRQLLFMMGLNVLVALLSAALGGSATAFLTVFTQPGSSGNLSTFLQSEGSALVTIVTALISTAWILASFFILNGAEYLLAKAFHGIGEFKQQAYNLTLIQVPISLINAALSILLSLVSLILVRFNSVLILLPFGIVGLAQFGVFIYGIVLNVFAIMAAHRLSGGRATGVVLIFYGIVIALVVCAYVALIVVVFAAFSSAIHSTTP